MAITVEPVDGAAAAEAFIGLHTEVYRTRSARWPAFAPIQLPLLRGEGPFAEGRRLRPLLVRDGGRPVARAIAAIDERYQRHWREPLGHVLLFEALPDTGEPVRLLMDSACAWLASEGATAARAGMGALEFPFVIDAYEALPPSWLRHNPSYYHGLLKDAGFETERGAVDYKIRVRPAMIARWESAVEAVRRAGYRLVPLGEVPEPRRTTEFTALWNEAFAAHWGYTPMTEGEMRLLTSVFAGAGMLETSLLAFEGETVVGGLWIVPDTSAFAALTPGRRLDDSERLNVLGIGVRATARGRGVNLAMAGWAFLELVRRGARYVSYTLVLDDNWPSRRTAEKLGATVCASYVTYRRPFDRRR